MNPEEESNQKTEQFLKSRVAGIKPSRASFEDSIKSVTNASVRRNTDQKAPTPSPYQLTPYSLMNKKIAYIGIPVVVVALIAIVALHGSKTNTEVATTANPGTTQEQTFTKDSSIDSISASFASDADQDATYANNESQDGQALQSDMQNYNDLQNTN